MNIQNFGKYLYKGLGFNCLCLGAFLHPKNGTTAVQEATLNIQPLAGRPAIQVQHPVLVPSFGGQSLEHALATEIRLDSNLGNPLAPASRRECGV